MTIIEISLEKAIHKMSFCDTHIHLNFNPLLDNIAQILLSLDHLEIKKFIIPATKDDEWHILLKLFNQYPEIANVALGVHPLYAESFSQEKRSILLSLLSTNPKLLIGEIGLDKNYANVTWHKQIECFEQQLLLGVELNRPLILHVRKAHNETISMLKKHCFQSGGIVHSFSGSLEEAQEYIKLGFKIGIGPAILKDNAKKIIKVVSEISLDYLVIETDAPDQGSPQTLVQVNNKIAVLKKVDEQEVANKIFTTSSLFFR